MGAATAFSPLTLALSQDPADLSPGTDFPLLNDTHPANDLAAAPSPVWVPVTATDSGGRQRGQSSAPPTTRVRVTETHQPLTLGVHVSPLWTQFAEVEGGFVIHQDTDGWPIRISATFVAGYSTTLSDAYGPYVGGRASAAALPLGDLGLIGAFGELAIIKPEDLFYAGNMAAFGVELTEIGGTHVTPITVGLGAYFINPPQFSLVPYWTGQLRIGVNWDFPGG